MRDLVTQVTHCDAMHWRGHPPFNSMNTNGSSGLSDGSDAFLPPFLDTEKEEAEGEERSCEITRSLRHLRHCVTASRLDPSFQRVTVSPLTLVGDANGMSVSVTLSHGDARRNDVSGVGAIALAVSKEEEVR